MRSRLTIVVLALAGISASQIGQFDPWLVVPGQSIGYTRIGAQMASVYSATQEPNGPGWEGDVAMGHKWEAWVGRTGHELDIYSVRGPDDSATYSDQTVRQIRVNSPSFHTPDGIGVGTDLITIRHKMPSLALAMEKGSMRLFDSPKAGIAFEIQRQHCVAIIVHRPNVGVLDEYLPFRTYWKPAKQTAK